MSAGDATFCRKHGGLWFDDGSFVIRAGANRPTHTPAAPAPDVAVFAGHFRSRQHGRTTAEIAALADIGSASDAIYFSAVPTITRQEIIAAAVSLRKAELEPIIHVAARRLASAADRRNSLSGLRGDADVRRLLVIGGDVDTPGLLPTPWRLPRKAACVRPASRKSGSALTGKAIAYSGWASGIRARREKSAATAQGLRVHIVSRALVSPERISAWLRQVRASGIGKPIKIGMAGPSSVPALLRYAKRCGVAASLRGLVSGVASGLIGHVGPDRIIETLSAAGDLGEVAPH